MTNSQKLLMLLVFSSLVACDNEGAKAPTGVQQTSGIQSAQPMSEIDQLNAFLSEHPDNFDAWSALGYAYFESRRYPEAIQAYDQAIAINPMCANCLNDKGLAMYYTGDTAGALVSFDKATQVAPDYVNAWLSKGFVLVAEKRYTEAMAPLNKVKELDPHGTMAAEADRFLQMAISNSLQ